MMIVDVHEASRNVLVCYGCVAMPGLVKIGRSRKEDKVNDIYSDDEQARLRRPVGGNCHQPDFEVYVNLRH